MGDWFGGKTEKWARARARAEEQRERERERVSFSLTVSDLAISKAVKAKTG